MSSKRTKRHTSDSSSSESVDTSDSDSERYAKRKTSQRSTSEESVSSDSDQSRHKIGKHVKSKHRKSSPSESDNEDKYRQRSRHDEKKSRSSGQDDRRHSRHHREEYSDRERSGHHNDHHRSKNDDRYESKKDTDRASDNRSHRYDHNDRDRRYRNDHNNTRDKSEDDKHDRRNDRHQKSRQRSPDDNRKSYQTNRFRQNHRRRRSNLFDHANAKWGTAEVKDEKKDKDVKVEKQKPNFKLSGKLTEETNTYRGVVVKYSEPPEARKPRRRWRLYPFKGEKALQTLYIHRESGYLIGRERKVVDIPVDHPSCSKQHAALQYRLVPFTREDGSSGRRIRPYLIDLDSANGTYINNKRIEARKYVELLEKDVIKFGYSSREYVMLHENSKDEAQDDDVKDEKLEELPIKEEP